MTTLFLIRHAQAEGNLYRIAQGQFDSYITALGKVSIYMEHLFSASLSFFLCGMCGVAFFSDAELEFYYMNNGQDLRSTIYTCLLIKAEDTTLSVSGMSCADSSKYFRRLASMYVPVNSGTLQ